LSDLRFASGRKTFDALNLQLARGERACFVHGHDGDFRELFHRRATTEQTPRLAAHAIAASTAEGIDSTSAHGEATTSSVMAR